MLRDECPLLTQSGRYGSSPGHPKRDEISLAQICPSPRLIFLAPGSARAYPATGAISHLSHISKSVTFMVPPVGRRLRPAPFLL